MLYWTEPLVTLYNGDARHMGELVDESVQMVVTSPPYWGLRKYAGEQNGVWGGDSACVHEWDDAVCSAKVGTQGMTETRGTSTSVVDSKPKPSSICARCGAWCGGFGLEPTPEMYVEHTVEILREVRRVLRPDGVVFWNIGDTYAGSGGTHNQFGQRQRGTKVVRPARPTGVIKAKDLCLIPSRIAVAAQEDGWYVRSIIIWQKPNPMPESVKDRPTESYEYILLLAKTAHYYWDADAVREQLKEASIKRAEYGWHGREGDTVRSRPEATDKMGVRWAPTIGRNLRSVWTFSTATYRSAHFATFPDALPERCIRVATPGSCVAPTTPALVLDPFAGTGTTLWVARRLGRRAVGYEISKEYCQLAVERGQLVPVQLGLAGFAGDNTLQKWK